MKMVLSEANYFDCSAELQASGQDFAPLVLVGIMNSSRLLKYYEGVEQQPGVAGTSTLTYIDTGLKI